MQHVTLFLYFVLLSSGFAGIVVSVLLIKKLNSSPLLWLFGIIGVFTFWLIITLVVFYVEKIILYPFPTAEVIGTINVILGIIVYAGMVVCVRKVYPLGRFLWLMCSVAPLVVFYTLYIFGSTLLPRFPSVTLISVVCSALFLTYAGVSFLRGAGSLQQETVRFIFSGLGKITLIFAPVSVIVAVIGVVAGAKEVMTIPLNYVYFFSWNVLVIIAFVRYMIKRSELLTDGAVSTGFINRYGISAREAEIIGLVAQGLSNKEIADELNISFTTVRTHIYNIYKKTGAGSRVDLLSIISLYRE